MWLLKSKKRKVMTASCYCRACNILPSAARWCSDEIVPTSLFPQWTVCGHWWNMSTARASSLCSKSRQTSFLLTVSSSSLNWCGITFLPACTALTCCILIDFWPGERRPFNAISLGSPSPRFNTAPVGTVHFSGGMSLPSPIMSLHWGDHKALTVTGGLSLYFVDYDIMIQFYVNMWIICCCFCGDEGRKNEAWQPLVECQCFGTIFEIFNI